MRADLICVGNELLTGLVENSNSGFLARRLWSAGISVREACVVADDMHAIRLSLERALNESELVIITGGLGPTDDDLTREAVAAVLELPLIINKQWFEKLEKFFSKRGIEMPANNLKQAMVVEGGILLKNKHGTAPGMIVERAGKIIVMLPGPPHELQVMFDTDVLSYLIDNNKTSLTAVKTLKCIGIGESMLEEKIKAFGKWELPPISYVARGYEVDLQIKGTGGGENAAASISKAEQILRSALGDYIYGSNDETLAGLVANLLISGKLTLALAESCSGGLLSDLITDIPGSSNFYRGGLIPYNSELKADLLGITKEFLDREGEVSAATAQAMAEGIKERFNADIAIGITGVAGPESDRAGNPVGLVYIAVSAPGVSKSKKMNLGGGRRAIKERSVQIALDMLRRVLLEI